MTFEDLLRSYVLGTVFGALSAGLVVVAALTYVSVRLMSYHCDSRTAVCIGKRMHQWNGSHEEVDYLYYGERVSKFPRGLIQPLEELQEPHVVVMRVSDGGIVAARVSPLLYALSRPGKRLPKWMYRTLIRRECCRI